MWSWLMLWFELIPKENAARKWKTQWLQSDAWIWRLSCSWAISSLINLLLKVSTLDDVSDKKEGVVKNNDNKFS